MVEATLLDFRFRVRSPKSVVNDSFQERGITVKSVARATSAAKKSVIGAARQLEMEEKAPFIPSTVGEFFFADDEGELPRYLDLQEVDLLYNDYIRVMTCMHERLRSVYN